MSFAFQSLSQEGIGSSANYTLTAPESTPWDSQSASV